MKVNNRLKKVFGLDAPKYKSGWIKNSPGLNRYIHDVQVWAVNQMVDLNSQKFVLDVGGGGGRWTNEFAEKGNNVIHTDISVEMSLVAREMANKSGLSKSIDFVVCDALKLPFKSNTFDIVNNSEVIYYFDDYKIFLKSLKRTAKSNSKIITSMMNNSANKYYEFRKYLRNLFNDDPYSGIENPISSYSLEKAHKGVGFQTIEFRGFLFFPDFDFTFIKIPWSRLWMPVITKIMGPWEKKRSNTSAKYKGRVNVFVGTC